MLDRIHRFHGLNSLSFVYKRGQVVRAGQVALKYTLNSRRQTYRAAIVVSRKVDKSAVVRNRIRRRIYEAIASQAGSITKPYDLVFTVYNAQLATMDSTQLHTLVSDLLRRAHVTSAHTGASRGIVNATTNRGKAAT
jgi:ribonuclease P protein component